ncbi:MAG: hypothetical protein KJ002_15085, partial [Candidatus Dadabacteria bacterium]|nr:hypothetical protein [Candidatus Dadabacteria bacterium]
MAVTEVEEPGRGRKTYDLKIIKWLYGFTGPYRKYMFLSLVLMLVTAALALAAAVSAKVDVDKYIFPSWRVASF